MAKKEIPLHEQIRVSQVFRNMWRVVHNGKHKDAYVNGNEILPERDKFNWLTDEEREVLQKEIDKKFK